jgi:hypothetical protein
MKYVLSKTLAVLQYLHLCVTVSLLVNSNPSFFTYLLCFIISRFMFPCPFLPTFVSLLF